MYLVILLSCFMSVPHVYSGCRVQKGVADPLELEFGCKTPDVSVGNQSHGPLEEQLELLAAEPALHPLDFKTQNSACGPQGWKVQIEEPHLDKETASG